MASPDSLMVRLLPFVFGWLWELDARVHVGVLAVSPLLQPSDGEIQYGDSRARPGRVDLPRGTGMFYDAVSL